MKTTVKIINLLLAASLSFSAATVLSGCEGGEYPVEVGNVTIKSQPESVVVLDASTADILIATGYDKLLVGRSDEVYQEAISVAPSMGAAQSPDTDKIIDSGATVVFAGENMNEDSRSTLEEKGIQVIEIAHPETPSEVETCYITVGKICGGTTTGAEQGESSYDKLLEELDGYKTMVTNRNSGILDTVCYLYTEDSELKMMTSGTYGDMLLGYTGAVNAAVNISNDSVDVTTLTVANPDYIFYADEATLEAVKNDATLSTLSAVKSDKMLMVSLDEISMPGSSAVTTLEKMIYFMYPDLNTDSTSETSDASSASETSKTEASSTAAATEQATTAAETAAEETTAPAESSSVADKYDIEITSDTAFEQEDESDDVKAMQQRLYDLGYVDDDENITGYYGEITAAAVKAFQKKNGLDETGSADNATVTAIFSSSAKEN